MAEICPGHVLDRRIQDWAHRELVRLNTGEFLDAARRIAETAKKLTADPYKILGYSNPESLAYAEAADAGDWNRANKICLDRLEIIDPGAHRETLYMESLARGFSSALACKASGTETIYRWMGLEELYIYLAGTFESKMRVGGGSRKYKPFSLGRNGYAAQRPASAVVPVDDAVRGALLPAVYTAVPWPVLPEDEKIDSPKHLVHADETECRLPDGVRVPAGTRILVKRWALNADPNAKQYYDLLESLKDMVQIRLT